MVMDEHSFCNENEREIADDIFSLSQVIALIAIEQLVLATRSIAYADFNCNL